MNDELKKSLSEIESQWQEIAANTIAEAFATEPSEDFYAAGFWLFYLDGQTVSPPALAINSESGVSAVNSYGENNRWNPADWPEQLRITAHEKMAPAYLALSEQLQGEEWSVWEEIDKLQKQAIARVCRRLTADIRSGRPPFDAVPAHPQFVVGIFDGRDSLAETNRLVRMSIKPTIIEELNIPFVE